MDSLSLLELNALVRRSLEQCLPDEYWIQAELSDVRSNTTGHCYLEFVQKDPRSNNLVAKARGMIWSNIYRLLKPYFEETTGQLFASGIKVLVKVTVQFHELYGYSLTVLDIDPAYTLGDMARRRDASFRMDDTESVQRKDDVEGNTSEYGDLLYCGGILPLPYKARFLVYGFGDGVSRAHRNRKLLCRFVPRNGAVPVGSRLDRHGDLRRG